MQDFGLENRPGVESDVGYRGLTDRMPDDRNYKALHLELPHQNI